MGSGRVWRPPVRLAVQGWNRVFHGCTGFTGWGFAWFAVSLLLLVSVAGLRFVVDWGRQDLCIVVSVRPGWARNYFTYFSVYSARCSDAPARGLGQSRGHQWGEAVYSQVFERRLPPGPVAILVLTGLAVDALVLPLLMGE